MSMKDYIEERVIKTAEYIVENGATVRAAAKVFGTSKSTTHKDLIERLPHINRELSAQVNHILAVNLSLIHIFILIPRTLVKAPVFLSIWKPLTLTGICP